ncbi:MAG: hypothetical protein II329_01070, partial [Clostridia bacterium]|nr:hypothetical protein [Clostridia bacterium]
LADEAEENLYAKMSEMKDIKNAYLSGNYRICRDMCINTRIEGDDEIALIAAECSLAIAKESFASGFLRSTVYYLDEAIGFADATVYYTEHIRSAAAICFRYMRNVSATLASDVIDEEENIKPFSFDDFSKYATAFEALETGNMRLVQYFLSSLDESSPYSLHIRARMSIKEGRFDKAYDELYAILVHPRKIEEPIMYFVFCDLEVCCKEKKDFKGAYEYSNAKLNILQKMLSDTDE